MIIEFLAVKSSMKEYQDRLYITSIDKIISQPYGQKISLITGLDQARLSINSINYVQVSFFYKADSK